MRVDSGENACIFKCWRDFSLRSDRGLNLSILQVSQGLQIVRTMICRHLLSNKYGLVDLRLLQAVHTFVVFQEDLYL